MSSEKEKASVISNLRACLISTTQGIPISHLNSDYRQIIGESIPYSRLGYKTLEDFLKTVPDLIIKFKGGQAFVEARANESSGHISTLVKQQKRSSKKKKFPANKPVVQIREKKPPRYRRRSLPATTAPPQRPPIRVNLPLNNISKGPNRQVSFVTHENNNIEEENRNVKKKIENTTSKKPPLVRFNSDSQANYKVNNDVIDNNCSSSSSSSIPSPVSIKNSNDSPAYSSKLSNRLQRNQSPVSSAIEPQAACDSSKSESKLSNRLKQVKQVPLTINTDITSGSFGKKSELSPSAKSPPITSHTVKKGAPPKVPKQSAQTRLEKTKYGQADQKLSVVVDHQQGERSSYFQNQLSLYVNQLKWEKEPSYVVYKQKSGKHQICYASTVRVVIPRMSSQLPEEVLECSTFPNDFLDPTEAKENGAKLALDRLKEREKLLNAPLLKDPTAIVNYVEQSVEKKDNGIWAHKFEDEFKLTHKQRLPEYWLDIIKVSAKFEVEELGPSCIIRMKDEANPHFFQSKLTMPSLNLPPGNTWDVFITGGTTVNDVRLRFIGDEYSARFDQFSTEMEKWYENKSHLVLPLLVIGEHYAAYYDYAWWRVVVTKIEVDKIRVKFIDHGDEEEISRSLLYKLEPQFFKVPPQAISVSLKGLEEFVHRKEAEDFFLNTIIARSLVAVVEDYRGNSISLVLYDTSSEEAVNLNEELRKLFELDYKQPISLEIGSVYEMFFCHIDIDGRVFVQIVSPTYTLLQDLLELVEENVYESLKDPSELDVNKIYFVHKNDNYIRAKPRNTHFIDGKVEVSFIDYGSSDYVFLEDITNIEEISYLLGQIPGQAVPVFLHDISSVALTPALRDRLIQLTSSEDPPVIVGRVRGIKSGIPVVEMFMRMTPDNLLVSINQTLVLETGLDKTGLSPKFGELSLKQSSKPKKARDLDASVLSTFPAGSIERIIADNRPPLPAVNDDFQIFVHDTASPSHFLINPQDYVSSLNKIMDDMNSYYNQSKLNSNLTEGAFCAAKDGSFWYRVYIDRIIDYENVSVKVLDYGCVKIIPMSNLRPLLPIFMKHPYTGFCAKLHGIAPIHGDWSVENCIAMKNLINKKTLRARLKDIILSRSSLGGITLCLQLFASDSKTGLEFDIAEQLIKQSHALFA